jgi:hypothetical protein
MFGYKIVFFLTKEACFRTSIRDLSRGMLASESLTLGLDDWCQFQGSLPEDVIAVLRHELISEQRGIR